MAPPGLSEIRLPWTAAVILGIGCLLNGLVSTQRTMSLVAPLATIDSDFDGFLGQDQPIPIAEARVAGATSSLSRSYARDSSSFLIYVGFYESQRQGRTIHSPKNCLPGAGWEPLESRREVVLGLGGESIHVNRFVVANRSQQALVYYWYQGRGRTEANEYQVKFDLIKDSALRRRSDEALVRIVVPLQGNREEVEQLARRMVARLHAELGPILPT